MKMYSTLTRAMLDKGITQRMIANIIGCHYNTVNAKMTGRSDFTLEEARIIHREFFAELNFTELFTNTDQTA